MSDPTSPAPPPQVGATPSNSTVATALGGALATIFMAVAAHYGLTFQAGVESALAVVISTLAGYLPRSGRK